jgi:tRNA threonylcarbamoyladenosine biosynthesis protein TsaB
MASTTVHDEAPRPILTIDTSSAQGGITLYDGQTLSTRSWPAARSHTTSLLPEIHHILAAADREVSDLAAIGVAVGPGPFTALRVGFGVAKGFHLATDAPLIGVATLAATALPFAACGGHVVATVSAGRGRLVWEHYATAAGDLVSTQPARNGTAAELAAELGSAESVVVCGELDDEQADLLASLPGVVVPPRPLRLRQPGAVALIAWRRWQAGDLDDAAAIEPIYLSR